MYVREKRLIILAQQGNQDALAQILECNKRTYMEYSKKVYGKRI